MSIGVGPWQSGRRENALVPGPSDLVAGPQITAWAVIPGAAQHLTTRFVDARAAPRPLTGSP
ncbi:hypothetical protein ACIF85_25915 [Streptomyces sp. NPDC086033]|uniref:hypothetical protein n=1 Tax=Streptomyces sp. NPDC086033 TaxID=3365747 RepID=UPI0037D0BC64